VKREVSQEGSETLEEVLREGQEVLGEEVRSVTGKKNRLTTLGQWEFSWV
jgi:hypothetical protein